MKLYHIQFDGQSYWVEAQSFGNAVIVWQAHVKVLWGEDFTGEEEPDSVQLAHDEPVIREQQA